MGKIVILLLTFAGMCLAQKKCCVPDKFEVLDAQIIGTIVSNQGVVIYQTVALGFDYTTLKAGELVNSTFNGKTTRLQYIVDYSKGAEYVINVDTKKCQKVAIPKTMKLQHCVPDNATFVATSYLGDHELSIDTFAYPYNENDLIGNVSLTVTHGNCILFSSSFVGSKGPVPYLLNDGYVNYVAGIKDPSKYFTVPKYCPKTFSDEPLVMESTVLKMLFRY